jgi:serine/threonine protein kinase
MSTESLLHNRYQLLEPIGHGGMCQVYLAEDLQNPEQPHCVVKTLRPALPDSNQITTAKTLFQRGAVALEKLGTHPQIPRLLDFFEENGVFYTVEELIQGHSLGAELQIGQRWSETEVVEFLQEILPVLDFVHSQNVIHRDIKPDNILRRDEDRKLVLIDFGAVRQINPQQTTIGPGRFGTVVGTFGYMPTEQGHGNPRPNSDIYALGIVCIQALTGLLPSQLLQDPETGEIRWQNYVPVSTDLGNILTKMVRYHFKDRHQSAAEVLRSLKTLERKRESMEPHQSSILNFSGAGMKAAFAPLVAAGTAAALASRRVLGSIRLGKPARPMALAGLGLASMVGAFWAFNGWSRTQQITFGGDRVLTVGILNMRSNPRQDYNNFTNYLRQQLRNKYGNNIQVQFDFVDISQPQGAQPARQAIESKKWELAFTSLATVSSMAVTNNYQFVAKMFPDRPEFRSVFFVRQESPLRSLSDITSRTTIAMGDFTNASSFYMPVYDLYGKSIVLNRGNRQIHQLVAQGRTEVGVGTERRIKELIGKGEAFRIIHTSRALPMSGVYLAPTLTAQERKELTQIMLSAPVVLQQQTHYAAGEPIDYSNFQRITQRVEEITSCTNWPEPKVSERVDLFCRPVAGVMRGYVARENTVNFTLQGDDGKTYRVVLARSVMRQDAALSAPGSVNFKRVSIANVQPIQVDGVTELRITAPGQMTIAAR